jgi:transposase InsO family protein
MKAAGRRGISRTKGPRTTLAGAGPDSRPDLVKRDFTATAQDRLWVADLTYVRTFADACRWTSGTNSTRASPLGSGHGRGSETLGTRPYT